MKKIIKLVSSSLVLSMVLASGVAFAEEVVDDDQKVTGNFTLEKRMYQHDGFGAQWAFDVGSDGLWFVNKEPLDGEYNAPLKIDNNASANTLVIGSSVEGMEGNIGIGKEEAVEAVDVERVDAGARFQLTSITNTGNQAPQFIQRRAHSSNEEPTAVKDKDSIGIFSFRGWNGEAFTGSKGMIHVGASEDWTTTGNGTNMIFRVTPIGSTKLTTGLELKSNGDMYVKGSIYAQNGNKMNVPDYVFDDSYNLMPLDEVENYINKNGHLPKTTSAKEIYKTGIINVSEMQMNLLEKVEELTLYTLQQEKKIVKLEKMQERLVALESLLTNLALDTRNSKEVKVTLNNK